MPPLKALMIDDDRLLILLTRKIIELADRSVVVNSLCNGNEGLNYLKENANNTELLPDIIFLDLNMPVMDGWDFLEEYSSIESEMGKKIRIVLFSSTISPVDFERAKRYAIVYDFIIKPLNKEKFISLIDDL
jgi:CheY-like chemotaxis protein